MNNSTDREAKVAIQALSDQFFASFSNVNGQYPKVKDLYSIFIPEAIIINNSQEKAEVYDLDNFILPREQMLTDGSLVNFREEEIRQETFVFGAIAQRYCEYEKSGELNGQAFETEGMKCMQFLKIGGEWKMSSVTWFDNP